MKNYNKQIRETYLISVFKTTDECNGIEITEQEYNQILEVIRNKPQDPEGYGYRIKEDLTWELYELPVFQEEALVN